MNEPDRKRLEEVRDLLSSADNKILAMLKQESKETFVKEVIETKKHEYDVEIVGETEKGVRLKFKRDQNAIWFPKSAVILIDYKNEGIQPVIIQEWILKQKEMI